MKDVLVVIAVIVIWILLQKVILPKLGIQT